MSPFSTYSQPGVVTLGSLEYIISDAIMRQPAAEFAVGLRLGQPQYDSREGAYFRNYNDFRGGFGVRAGDPRTYPDRFFSARDVRTWNSEMDITLAPILTEATLGTIVPSSPGAITPGAGWAVAPDAAGAYTLFGAMGNKVYSTTGTTTPTFTNITPGSGPSSAQTFSLITHTNPTNLSDRGLFWATGATDEIWKRSLTAGTWSQPNATQKSDSLIEFDRKLLSVFAGQVSISADGGVTYTDLVKVPSDANFAPFWAGIGLDPYGQFMPYLVSAGVLYIIDVWTRQAIPIDLGLPSSVTAAITWQDGEVIVTDGYYVKAYHPQRPVKNMGFDRDNGPFTQSFIRDFYVVAGKFLLASVDVGSTANIYMWDGAGWHVVVGADAIFGPFGLKPQPGHNMLLYNGSSVYSPAQELFLACYGSGRPYIYHMASDAFKNPQLNGAHKYAGSVDGHIVTPWDDGGFSEMPGTAIEVEVHGIFTTSEYLQVQYQIDNDVSDTWTTLGSTNSTATVHRLQFGATAGKGISFKNIRFRFLFKRGANNLLTPVVRSIVFKYLKVPRLRSSYAFTVDVTATAKHRGVTEEVVIDTLYALVDDTPLTDFAYTSEGTFFVRFTAMPRVDKQQQDGTTKTSIIRVTVEEPV